MKKQFAKIAAVVTLAIHGGTWVVPQAAYFCPIHNLVKQSPGSRPAQPAPVDTQPK